MKTVRVKLFGCITQEWTIRSVFIYSLYLNDIIRVTIDRGYDFAGASKYTYRILVCSHLENSDLETGKEKEMQFIYTRTRNFRRNLPYFGRTFLRLIDIYIIKHSHTRSFTVAEKLTGDECDLAILRTVPVWHDALLLHCVGLSLSRQPSQAMRRRVCYVTYLEY